MPLQLQDDLGILTKPSNKFNLEDDLGIFTPEKSTNKLGLQDDIGVFEPQQPEPQKKTWRDVPLLGSQKIFGKPVTTKDVEQTKAFKYPEAIRKGALQTVLSSPQAGGALLQEMGETMGSKPHPAVAKAFDILTATPMGAPYKGLWEAKKLKNVIAEKTQVDEIITQKAKDLISANQRFIKTRKLETKGDDKVEDFLFNVGSGVTTLAGALGLSYITKNPSAASIAFGVYQKGQIYKEAREAGVEPDKASALSTVAGGVEAGLEYVGLDIFFKKFGGRLASIAIKTATEAMQEFSQTTGENIIVKYGWDKTRNLMQGAWESAAIGALLGLPASVVIDSGQKSGDIPTDVPPEIITKVVEAQKEVIANEIEKIVKAETPTEPTTTPQPAPPLVSPAQAEGKGIKVYRTEEAHPVYKGKKVWGEGLYLGLNKADVADMTLDPSSQIVKEPKWDTVKEYTLPSDVRLKEIDTENMSPAEFNKMLGGDALKKQVLSEGYDGIKILTGGDLNLGGDQIVIYNSKIQPSPDIQSVKGEGGRSVLPKRPAMAEEITETKVSGIAKSIEAKAIEDKLTKGFSNVAEYTPITIKAQAKLATDLINSDINNARSIIRGEVDLPQGLKGTALITGMEEYIKKNPSADLAYELANSPLVSETSSAAQEMRLAAERNPDSATVRLQEVRKARELKSSKTPVTKKGVSKILKTEINKINLTKAELSWDRFLSQITC